MAVETDPIKPLRHERKRFARLAGSLCLLLLLLFLIWNAGRAGFASLLTTYAASANELAAANAAVSLSPRDPDAHYIRAAIFEANDDFSAALAEYTQAVILRPDDYVLWLGLAHAREINGNTQGAVEAASRAVQLAPYYAKPHWHLGNILVRAGQREEGFKELRRAATSDPALWPGIIDLAWQLSGGDVKSVKQAIQPQSAESYKALAEYFKKRGEVVEAIVMFGSAGSDVEVLREREQYINELISAKRFKDAYELWSIGRGLGSSNALGAIVDPGFEQESNLDEPGFGWRSENKTQTVTLSLDTANPKEGKSSLRVEFNGDSDPATPIISQLVLVEPNSRYQLHFAARSESIVSGGLPRVAVVDAGNKEIPGQTNAFPEAVSNWQDYSVDFTPKETTAIRISLQRERCNNSPCPIFGRLWLDNFSLVVGQSERLARASRP